MSDHATTIRRELSIHLEDGDEVGAEALAALEALEARADKAEAENQQLREQTDQHLLSDNQYLRDQCSKVRAENQRKQERIEWLAREAARVYELEAENQRLRDALELIGDSSSSQQSRVTANAALVAVREENE